MFRVVFMVEDRNLHKVLHALTGLVVNMEPPQPVTNAVVKNGKVKEVSSGATKKERFFEGVQALKGSAITTDDLKKVMASVGGAPTSINGIMAQLFKRKIIKRKSMGHYTVL